MSTHSVSSTTSATMNGLSELPISHADRDAFIGNLSAAIMALEADLSANQNQNESKEVDRAADDRKLHEEQALEALRKARDAAEDGSFWSDVTSVAKCVAEIATAAAAIAAVAATGGAAAPVLIAVGACVAAGANVAKLAGCDSAALPYIEVGGGIFAAGVAGGAALFGSGATIVATETASTTTKVLTVTAAAAGLVGGVGVFEKGRYDDAQQHAYGDNTAAKGLAKQDDIATQGALDRVRSSGTNLRRAAGIAANIQDQQQDTQARILSHGGV